MPNSTTILSHWGNEKMWFDYVSMWGIKLRTLRCSKFSNRDHAALENRHVIFRARLWVWRNTGKPPLSWLKKPIIVMRSSGWFRHWRFNIYNSYGHIQCYNVTDLLSTSYLKHLHSSGSNIWFVNESGNPRLASWPVPQMYVKVACPNLHNFPILLSDWSRHCWRWYHVIFRPISTRPEY